MSLERTHKVSDLIAGSKLCIGDGYRAKNTELGSTGIPFARAGDINDGFHFTSGDHLPLEDAWKAGNKLSEVGDVVFTSKGTVGRFGYVTENIQRFVYSPQLCFWRSLDRQTIQPRFLFYWIQGKEFYQQYKCVSQKTDMAEYVSLSDQRSMEITLPDLQNQKAIAHILGTLDDKIELNRKTNETLEAMAKALFQSWFVDFDPVRAKAEGRPTGLPDEISDLFPDSFEETELGEIPRGWEIAAIDHIVNLRKDSVNPSDSPEEEFDHYSIPAFDAGKSPSRETGGSIKSQKFQVGENDLLVSKLNPASPRIWIPFSSSARRSICSTEFLVCQASTCFGRAFAYCLASSDSIIEAMIGLAGGTSNSHQRIRPGDFLALACCMGSQKVRSAFSDVVEPLLGKTLALRTESRSLASARDTLLPKLISGELRIPEAEKLLEQADV
jgi:type I restriction enzyme S subunit